MMTRMRAPFAIERQGYNRQQLMRGREEARQEAVLWEAKCRDSVGENGLLLSKDLQGDTIAKDQGGGLGLTGEVARMLSQ